MKLQIFLLKRHGRHLPLFLLLHFRCQKKIELTSNEAVKQSVLAGFGFSAMPLISCKNKSFSPVAEVFLKYSEEEKKDILANYFSWYEEVS